VLENLHPVSKKILEVRGMKIISCRHIYVGGRGEGGGYTPSPGNILDPFYLPYVMTFVKKQIILRPIFFIKLCQGSYHCAPPPPYFASDARLKKTQNFRGKWTKKAIKVIQAHFLG
jgi:hypothetical protein